MTTFAEDLKVVTLQPGDVCGDYYITINDIKIFDGENYGSISEIKKIKKLVWQVVNPTKSLGHFDKNRIILILNNLKKKLYARCSFMWWTKQQDGN